MPPHQADMLEFLGLEGIDQLFEDIPSEVRTRGLDLPPGVGESETVERVQRILSKNRSCAGMLSFLGAGYYDMYVPAVVESILSRSEFYTSYTPYQAELSQGLMQALFEYQSLICELTGMDAANGSMYDGSTALGEAALMCARITRKREFVIPRALHWEKKSVLLNYARGPRIVVREVDYDIATGTLDLNHIGELVGKETAGVYVENPNFFGLFDDGVLDIKEACGEALLVVGTHPIAQGIVKPPGDYGADIVIGEGQSLGNWMSLGGPSLGIFSCRQEHIRKMPGRVIGLTQDSDGRRAFCMTLQTREQHIRKERAMSNICTNEALLAVAAAVYLAWIGEDGLRKLGAGLVEKARTLMAHIDKLDLYRSPIFPGHYFNEFPVACGLPYPNVHEHLLERGIHGGIDLSSRFPELGSAALFAVTDRHGPEDFDRLVSVLEDLK
ncbi:MAG: aminomethyl-transferring glycine dehydrogenase subunit GcvPA [Thermoplasmata archaeon]